MTRYVALLRGINVGGRNLIAMPSLKACFEAEGLRDVATYIQSGNVLFTANAPAERLARRLERMLKARFRYEASLVLRTARQMRAVLERAPRGFGTRPAHYRYDVVFLKEPLTAPAALKRVPRKEGVDRAHAGPGVIYFSRLIRKATQSRLSRIVSLPIYQSMTIRNWNTTTALRRMLEK